jgi:hypothetical protein
MKIEQQVEALFENGVFPAIYISPDGRIIMNKHHWGKELGWGTR